MFKAIIKSTASHMLAPLAAMSLLAACDLRSGSATTAAPSPSATNTPVSSTQAGPSASQSTPASSASPALATADGEKPGVRIEVQELKRTSGDTLTLKFVMINDSNESYLLYGCVLCDPEKNDHGTVSGVNLIEGVGKKKYFVVRDTEGACLCSRSLYSVVSKSSANLWAKFPAPPGDASKITVVVPHFTPMEDVPISQ
jgi:hypothetical protein